MRLTLILPISLLTLYLGGCSPAAKEDPGKQEPKERSQHGKQIRKMEPRDGAVIHRAGAGNPDPDGWYTAESTQGLFTVRLPGPFQDMTVTSRDEGVLVYQYYLTHDSNEKVRFAALGARRADGTSKLANLEELVDSLTKGQSITNKREVMRGNIRGFEFKGINKSWVGLMRVFTAKKMDYVLVVEYPTKLRDAPAAADVERFFDSFILPRDDEDR